MERQSDQRRSSSQKNWAHGAVYLLETGALAVYPQLSSPKGLLNHYERWLTAYTAYYNHRSHQALDNQPPVEALKQRSSI